ncbi:protein kinase [Bacteroidota bacterium]
MIGKTILHYNISKKLGEGGMGIVYLAEDTKLKRQVAIKFLPRYISSNKEERQRFEIEAQAAASLNHPNISHIYAIEETDDEMFIVMEYIDGQELKDKIKSEPLPVEECAAIALKIAEGLEAAHNKGIVHRDIKSSNIMISTDGQVKIMDFGLAKLGSDNQITKMGSTMGTAAYMSPEQTEGENVDKRTDIWSFGVVLYEILTNQLPFKGDYEQAVIYSILNEEPHNISDLRPEIPGRLVEIINKCLEKDPVDRYQSFSELLTDLKIPVQKDSRSSISTESIDSASTTAIHTTKSKLYYTLTAAAAVIFLAALLFPSKIENLKSWLNIDSVPDKQHLLVLPVTNIGGDSSKQAFCDGLVETLTSKLSQLEQYHGSLWVVPSSEMKRQNITSPSEAHQSFGVNLAVTGSLQILQDVMRLTLNLIDADNLRQINSSVIDVRESELSKLQDNSVVKLLEMLNLELNPKVEKVIYEGVTTVPGAYDFYVQGRGYLLRYENVENIDIAIRLFQKSIEEDSLYALAHAALAESFWRKYVTLKDTAYVGKAHHACETALKLNDQLAPVNVTMGIIHTGIGEYKDAVDFFNTALNQDPRNAEAYRGLAKAYEAQGLFDEAELTYKRALNLKPDYWGSYNDLGVFYYRNSRYEDAIKQFQQVILLTPDNYKGYNNLGGIFYLLERWKEAREMFDRSFKLRKSYNIASNLGTLNYIEGRFAEAAEMYEAALVINDNDYQVWANLAAAYYRTPGKMDISQNYYKNAIRKAEEQKKINPKDPDIISSLASFYADIGERTKSLKFINESIEMAPGNAQVMFRIASSYERLGERVEALNWIGKALENGYSKSEIEHQPELRELIADERYQNLFKDNPGIN